jgi:hypothetical protein
MIKRILVVTVLMSAFVVQAAVPSTSQSNYVYLLSGSNLRISIETYQTRQGWTPVTVSVAGTEVTALMDGQGRVVRYVAPAEGSTMTGGTGRAGHAKVHGFDKPILPLFTIELEKGRILLGREAHAIRIYEQNGVRTRFIISEGSVALPLGLDRRGKIGTLRFGGLEIPARVNVINPRQTTGNKLNPQVVVPLQSMVQKRHISEAQLMPSRIRARGK